MLIEIERQPLKLTQMQQRKTEIHLGRNSLSMKIR